MRYQGRSLSGERIIVDDNEYIECVFEDCTFAYAGGKLTLERCKVEGSIQLALGGAAENTAAFLRIFMGNESGQLAVASVLGAKVPGVGTH